MSITDYLPFPHHIKREPIATKFYPHPYGGIARDISVTRDGFMRFFELDDESMMFAEAFAGQGKLYDKIHDEHETLGYINILPGGKLTYDITVINRDHTRVGELLQIAPYLWEGNDDCNPHGIERPALNNASTS